MARATYRTMALSSLLLLGGVAALGAGYVRLAPLDAATWHADPEDGARTGRPNDYLLAQAAAADAPPERFALSPTEALARLDAVATAEPGVTRLAGAPEDGHVTYVQRTKLMGYPDVISAKALPEGDGATLSIWSRSRYGHSDLGVNRARVERWLAKMRSE